MGKCAVPDCPKQVHQTYLMCRPHWFSVPKPLRDAVWKTWKAFERSREPGATLVMKAYKEAREDAIAAAVANS